MSSMTCFLRYPACLAILGLIVVMVAAVFCPQQAGPSASGSSAPFPCVPNGGNTPPPCIQQAATITATGAANPGWFGVIVADLRRGNISGPALPQDTRGVLVDGVTAGSPGATIGIRPDDVIVGVNGRNVVDLRSFSSTIAGQAPGSVVALDVMRQGRLMRLSAGNASGGSPFSTAV